MIARISDTTLQRSGTLSLDWVILSVALLGTSVSVLHTAAAQAPVGMAAASRQVALAGPAVADGL